MTKNKKQYKLNLNTQVTIFLQPTFTATLPADIEMHHKNPDGSYTIELWEIMSIFGKGLYNGCKIPFINNEIIIPGEDLEEI